MVALGGAAEIGAVAPQKRVVSGSQSCLCFFCWSRTAGARRQSLRRRDAPRFWAPLRRKAVQWRRAARRHFEARRLRGTGANWGAVLELGYALDVRALYAGGAVPFDLGRHDLLVVMGGPMGVRDLGRPEYPFLEAEVTLLRQRIAESAPVLGVCLGAQLLAHAAGAVVFPMTNDHGQRLYEVGWGPISFQRGSLTDLLRDVPDEAMVLHWHGDTFELPAGAQRLASSARCPNQAFQLGTCQFGVQFHCEVGAEEVAGFIRADTAFVERANGAGSLQRLREETAGRVSALRSVGDLLLKNILAAMISG